MAYKEQSQNLWAALRIMMVMMIASIAIIAYLTYSLNEAAKTEWVDMPAAGIAGKVSRVKPGVMQNISVYNFAERTFQGLHRWKYDGSKEYTKNIKEFGYVITPYYKAFLRRDEKRKRGKKEKNGKEVSSELNKRTRMMLPLLNGWDSDRVKVIGIKDGKPNTWIVFLDMELIEHYKGEEMKHLYLRYPLRVVLDLSDQINNPWFLQLDGYHDQPAELTKDLGFELKKKGAKS